MVSVEQSIHDYLYNAVWYMGQDIPIFWALLEMSSMCMVRTHG